MNAPAASRRVSCSAEQRNLPSLLDAVESLCSLVQAGPDDLHDALLIAEEVCVNVIRHAYAGAAAGSMTLLASVARSGDGARLTLIVSDQGRPFDPLSLSPPDLAAPAEQRQVGGLGIHLVRQLADRVAYRRDQDMGNVLTIEKNLACRPLPQA